MQPRRWSELYLMTGRVAERLPRGGRKFSDRVIALTLLWAAFNHRPISWATQRRNWPVWMQRLLPEVPTSTTMSRRLRAPSIRAFMDELLQEAQGPMRLSMIRVLDGTAFEIRGHSQDRQAGYGFGTSRKSKGYKLHVLLDAGCGLVDWRIAPMNVSEQAIAERMLLGVDELLYVVGDGGYDSRFLYQIVRSKGWADGGAAAASWHGSGPPTEGAGSSAQHRSDRRALSVRPGGPCGPEGDREVLRQRRQPRRSPGRTTCMGAHPPSSRAMGARQAHHQRRPHRAEPTGGLNAKGP